MDSKLHRNPTPWLAIQPIRDEDFRKKTQQGLCLVEFSAPWCLSEEARLNLLARETLEGCPPLRYFYCDVDQRSSLPAKLGVFSLPAWILFHRGLEVDRLVGVQTKPGFLTNLCRSAWPPEGSG